MAILQELEKEKFFYVNNNWCIWKERRQENISDSSRKG